MEIGTVKVFFKDRGYGFISRASGRDIFVHASGIANQCGRRTLEDGESVSYEVTENERGPLAVNVTKV